MSLWNLYPNVITIMETRILIVKDEKQTNADKKPSIKNKYKDCQKFCQKESYYQTEFKKNYN